MSPARGKSVLDEPEPETPEGIRAAAEAEVTAAKAAVTTLEDALKAGDQEITPEDLDNARKRVNWSELRSAAAEVRAVALEARLSREAARQSIEANYELATKNIEPEVRAILDQVRAPIAKALELITAKNDRIVWLAEDLAANPQPDSPKSFFDGSPQKAWVATEDGSTVHRYVFGVEKVLGIINEIIREVR